MAGDVALALPPLRDELVLHPGPAAADGAPSWILHDPARNKFFRLSWQAFEILSRWDVGDPAAVAASINAETVLEVTADDVLDMARFVAGNFLIRPNGIDHLMKAHQAARQSWLNWLLHHYLFFRVPLVRPDRALGRILPWFRWAWSPSMAWASLGALVAGIYLVGRQWDLFLATLVSTASLSGLAWYGIALAGAKVAHEMGHALTAKRLGCRVPTMGVAFLVLWPVLYTDVTEAWKLSARRQRLAIGAAGIAVELMVAIWASLAWGLLPDGPARSAAFVLATTTWIATLAINLSPFMRFDGYFLAMDALDMPNLHGRSFAMARWWLRETLFALGEPAPEAMTAGKRAALIAFALATWAYRLVLFLGIAVLVYHFFIKAVGIVLFIVEIGWFVVMPVWSEIKEWWLRKAAIGASRRARRLAVGLGGLALLGVIPWQAQISAPAVLQAVGHAPVFTQVAGRLEHLAVSGGATVEEGQVVAVLSSPDLDFRLRAARAREEVLRYEMDSVAFEGAFRERAQQLAEALGGAAAERAGAERELARLTVAAPASGRVVDVDPTLAAGQWLGAKTQLMGIIRPDKAEIEALVVEQDLERIAEGNSCTFHPERPDWPVLSCVVARVDKVGSSVLPLGHLADVTGGPIPVRVAERQLVADKSYYRVRLEVTAPFTPPQEIRGTAEIEAGRASLLGGVARSALAVLIRELGF